MLARIIAWVAMRGALVACSCGEGIYRPACEAFFDAGAVFVGTVVSRNGPEPWPSYSVHVEENYKGLPKNAHLVFVDAGFVCGGSFDLGAKYLFYAEQPKDWPRFTYSANICSGTREVEYATEDICLAAHAGEAVAADEGVWHGATEPGVAVAAACC